MNDTTPNGEPSSSGHGEGAPSNEQKNGNFSDVVRGWMRGIKRMSSGSDSPRDTLDELIEEREDSERTSSSCAI